MSLGNLPSKSNLSLSSLKSQGERLDSVDEYILKISAGPAYDKLEVIHINNETLPVLINNDYFTGYILVRVNGFQGITPDSSPPKKRPDSKYFKNRNRKYSITVQGRFKQDYHGDEILFGVDSDKKLMPIPGVWVGIRLCKWLDPALEAHLDGDLPHIYSPILSCMNQMAVFDIEHDRDLTLGRKLSIDCPESLESVQEAISLPKKYHTISSTSSTEPLDVKQWAFAHSYVPEHSALLFDSEQDKQDANTFEKRKKVFASKQKRESTTIKSDKLYCMDFYDAYFDLTGFSVKLPGFSINAFKYWDGEQPLRYVCRTRDGSKVFFVVQMVSIFNPGFGEED